MKNQIAIEKTKKKFTGKRKFYSSTDLPTNEVGAPPPNMFFVSPEEIRKYKEEVSARIGEDKIPKKTKPKQKKKLSDAAVDKILMEPLRPKTTENKNTSEDYQWLIKRNILKLMSAASKKTKEEPVARKKTANKAKQNSGPSGLQKTKSDVARDNQKDAQVGKPKNQKRTRKTKSASKEDVKPELNIKKRLDPVDPQWVGKTKEKRVPSGKSGLVLSSALPLHPKLGTSQETKTTNSNIKALKKLFNVFKAPQHSAKKNKDGAPFVQPKRKKMEPKISGNLLLPNEEKQEQPKEKKKTVKKNKAAEKKLKKAPTKIGQKKIEQIPTTKSYSDDKTLKILAAPPESRKVEKKGKKESSQKLLQALSM